MPGPSTLFSWHFNFVAGAAAGILSYPRQPPRWKRPAAPTIGPFPEPRRVVPYPTRWDTTKRLLVWAALASICLPVLAHVALTFCWVDTWRGGEGSGLLVFLALFASVALAAAWALVTVVVRLGRRARGL
jgi:hypothetical protein